MSPTFYFLFIISSASLSNPIKPKFLIENDEPQSESCLCEGQVKDQIDKLSANGQSIIATKLNLLSDNQINNNSNTEFDKMLNDIVKATNEIIKGMYNLLFYKRFRKCPKTGSISLSKLKVDVKLDIYLEKSFGDNFNDKIKNDFKDINEEELKKYNDAYENYISATEDYKKLFNVSKITLENYKAGFSTGPIEIIIHGFYKSGFPDLFNLSNYKIPFDDIKSLEKFMHFIYNQYEPVKKKKNDSYDALFEIYPILEIFYDIFNYCFDSFCLLFDKESILYEKFKKEILFKNRMHILHSLIEYLNYQKLEFLNTSINLSKNVYLQLKNFIELIKYQKYYTVNVKDNTLNLFHYKYGIVPESESKPIAQNEPVEGNSIIKDFAGQADANYKED